MSDLPISDVRVQRAMATVHRADFLPADVRAHAGEDRPLDIGDGQTTSQPSLIAYMVDQLNLLPPSRVLEVGTGCGYQTALLAQLCAEVYSVELLPALSRTAAANLERVGVKNVHLRVGDGYLGWPEKAPFDGIVVSATAPRVPPALVDQLAIGARLLIPVGPLDDTQLLRITRLANGELRTTALFGVRFVPLINTQRR